ncbi:TIGR00270 family protein [Candidatus Bathyarchaeota archaeon]|nr:TIGR00270 family protein [Candidatus Bathyarchaeota archaeon]
MLCEVCGAEIRGEPYYRIIERGRMTVCGRCAKFGTTDWDPSRPQVRRTNSRPAPRRPRNEMEAAEVMELVNDYGIMIKKARQKKGLSVEDFARMISEKESVVKNLERGQFTPDSKLVRKIKNTLQVDVLEAPETGTRTQVTSRPTSGRTLGDLLKETEKSEEDDED